MRPRDFLVPNRLCTLEPSDTLRSYRRSGQELFVGPPQKKPGSFHVQLQRYADVLLALVNEGLFYEKEKADFFGNLNAQARKLFIVVRS
jgi:hypothetical protein